MNKYVPHYKTEDGAIVGPGFETEDGDCRVALKGADGHSTRAILRLLNDAYAAGRRDKQEELRDALGIKS